MYNTQNKPGVFDDEVLITKTPFNYYLTIIVTTGVFLFFLALALNGRLDIWGASICFLFFSLIFYANFGRYLAKIKLFGHRIEVYYFFPWNPSEIFKFDRLIEIDHKDMPWLSRFERWYRGYLWLYLKNDKGQVCQIRYNINVDDDEKLLKEIKNNFK
jgi:hypothetical protein